MAASRKLQGEIDRCLKKVDEGAEAFEEIWQKVQNATNVNQKEKYEAELKREIKKLQRLREQIKTWLTSGDIKDKRPLLEYRKLIEIQMERFRIIEKETKTKAYSKEGLGQVNKVDPETKQYESCREWINEAIHNLGFQVDRLESELETLQAGTKKKKLDKDKTERVEELRSRLDQHKHHISSLEHVLRKLDNGTLEVKKINKVKDDVEYYVENCQEPDFIDYYGVYDDLDLEAESELEHSMKKEENDDEDDDIHSSPSSSLNSAHSGILINSPASKSVNGSPRKNSKSSTNVATSTTSTNSTSVNGTPVQSSTTTTTTPSTTPSKRNLFPVSTTTTSVTTNDDTVKPLSSVPLVNGLDHTLSDTTTSLLHTSDNETTLSTAPYAVAAAPVSSNTTKITTTQSQPNKLLSSVEQNAVQVVRSHVESLKYPGSNPNPPLWRTSSSSDSSETTNITTASNTITKPTVNSSDPLKPIQDVTTSVDNNNISLLTAISREIATNVNQTVSSTLPNNMTSSFQTATSSLSHELEKQLGPNEFNLKANSLFGGVLNPSLAQKDTQEVRLQPVHGVAPLGPVLLTQERLYQLKMLDAAFYHVPQRQDCERMRPYISRSAVPIAPYHHHQPPPNIDSLEFFQRLSTETLFFIFYYQEGTRAQYLAAKALKKQSWRFHTKYMMWFQRHEEPKRITDEFEEGTYIFFDYEKWSQRKRDGFTFEYRYLEDKDLP